jgi:hypothetical protein
MLTGKREGYSRLTKLQSSRNGIQPRIAQVYADGSGMVLIPDP